MLKTALFDCAINEKCCSVDGGRGICPLFSSPPRGIWQLKSPHPREFAIQGKKNANARGSARGGAWAQVELTDALLPLTGDQNNGKPRRDSQKHFPWSLVYVTFLSTSCICYVLVQFLLCWHSQIWV